MEWVFDVFQSDKPALIASLILLVGSVLLYQRIGSVANLVQLIGSIAFVLMNSLWTFLGYMALYGMTHSRSTFARMIYPTDTPHPAFEIAHEILMAISFCFAIGFVWFAIRTKRRA